MINQKVNGKEVIRKFKIMSWTSSNSYVVCELEDKSFSCSCPVWIFGRKECKHIIDVKDVLNNKKRKINEIGVEFINLEKCSAKEITAKHIQ